MNKTWTKKYEEVKKAFLEECKTCGVSGEIVRLAGYKSVGSVRKRIKYLKKLIDILIEKGELEDKDL